MFLETPCFNRVWGAAERIRQLEVDLITFHRGEMAGYPPLQVQTEQEASRRIAEITGLTEYDSHSGPLMGIWSAWEWLLAYDGQYGNMWQSTCVLPPLRALVGGHKVGIMQLPEFRYPLAQRLAEEGEPTMESKRHLQAAIPDDIERYVADVKAQGDGLWPPADFIMLD